MFCLFQILVLFQSLSSFEYVGLLFLELRKIYIMFKICNYVLYIILFMYYHVMVIFCFITICGSGQLMMICKLW